MNNDKEKFPSGMIIKRNENAPDFVVCSISIRVDELTEWLKTHSVNGWVNIDVLTSKESGKSYAVKNEWKPEKKQEKPPVQENDESDDFNDLPF